MPYVGLYFYLFKVILYHDTGEQSWKTERGFDDLDSAKEYAREKMHFANSVSGYEVVDNSDNVLESSYA